MASFKKKTIESSEYDNQMKKENKDNTLLVIIGIIVLIIVVFVIFRLTYAYFTATIKELNPTDKDDAVVSTAKLEVEYVDGDSDIELNEKIGPDTTITKKFSVKNNGTSTGYYAIVLKDIVNEFNRPQDLKYTLEKQDGTPIGIGTITATPAQFPTTSDATKTGGQVVIAVKEQVEKQNDYVLTVTYENPNEDQSDDMGQTLAAKIDIIEVDNEERNAESESKTSTTTTTQGN